MPSGTHGPAFPQRPGHASSRDPRAIRERFREKEADNTEAVFVVALDQHHAVVHNQGGGVDFVVENPNGASLSPGSIVKLGSLTGHEHGRFIIAGAPPARGRSAPPVSKAIRIAGFNAPAPVERPPYIGIFYDQAIGGGSVWAYNYQGGVIGSLIATLPGLGFATPDDVCLLSHSPLVVVMRDSDGAFWTWNVTANTMASDATHPASGFDLTTMVYRGDGKVRFVESKTADDTYKLFEISAAGVITQVTMPGGDVLASPLAGVPTSLLHTDGETAFLIVFGDPGDSGVIQFSAGLGQPTFAASDTAFPGSGDDWAGWTGGHLLTTWGESLAYSSAPHPAIYGLWGTPGSEPLIDPYVGSVFPSMVPNAAGDAFALYTHERVALVVPPTTEGALDFDDVEAGPTATTPFMMVPVG